MKRKSNIQKLLDAFTEITFKTPSLENVCATCGSTAMAKKDFKDELSRKEARISRTCQKCQDFIFRGNKFRGSKL